MWIRFWNAFAKITGWPVQWFCFRTRVYYEDKAAQGRRIHGPAILVSNHTALYDYAVYLFVFFSRTLRFQMAELLFDKKVLGSLLKKLGGIYVDRNSHDLSFMARSEDILRQGGIVGVFPEGRLPREGEERPLLFSTSAVYLALCSGAPIIPLYTNGSYFHLKRRARVVIGRPIYAAELLDANATEKENLIQITEKLRDRVIELGTRLP